MAKESQTKFDLFTAVAIAVFVIAFAEPVLRKFGLLAETQYIPVQVIVISWCFGLLFGWQPVNKK